MNKFLRIKMFTFAVNLPNHCDWMVNILILVTPRSSLDLSLTIYDECLPTLDYASQCLTNRQRTLRTARLSFTNNFKQMKPLLANVTNAYKKCLRKGSQTLIMHLGMLRMSYHRCQCLAFFCYFFRTTDYAAAIAINTAANLALATCSI